jgi:hypothetical protein
MQRHMLGWLQQSLPLTPLAFCLMWTRGSLLMLSLASFPFSPQLVSGQQQGEHRLTEALLQL